MTRLDGWESRLVAAVESARARPYVLGEHDCFRLACQVLEALTGSDRWAEFAGKYRTRREALALLAQHGSSFTEAFSWFFGSAPAPMGQARRGDIAEIRDPQGQCHLGVVLGAKVALLEDNGLEFLPRSLCAHAWRIG
jgi:hypothetical protein